MKVCSDKHARDHCNYSILRVRAGIYDTGRATTRSSDLTHSQSSGCLRSCSCQVSNNVNKTKDLKAGGALIKPWHRTCKSRRCAVSRDRCSKSVEAFDGSNVSCSTVSNLHRDSVEPKVASYAIFWQGCGTLTQEFLDDAGGEAVVMDPTQARQKHC